MGDLFDTIGMIFERSGFKAFLADGGWKTLIMYVIVGVLVYLAIVKKFEPLLLLPIAFGMLLDEYPLAPTCSIWTCSSGTTSTFKPLQPMAVCWIFSISASSSAFTRR